MKEFMLVFRRDVQSPTIQMSAEQMHNISKPWLDWMATLTAQNKLVSTGSRLAAEGRVIRPGNVVTSGPYVEIKEAIGGYVVVKANSIDEAVTVANGCPILSMGGSVEVRSIVPVNNQNS